MKPHRKRFRKIYVEITNRCNLQCSFCSLSQRQPKNMSLAEFETIAVQIAPLTNVIYLHVKGEPLLHPQLPAILDLCLKYHLEVVMVTNGTLLHAVEDVLISHPSLRQINFSLHCYHELPSIVLRQQYLNSVFAFVQRSLHESTVTISLRLWNFLPDDTASTIQLNNEIIQAINRQFTPPDDWQHQIASRNGIRLSDRLWINSDYRFDWPQLSGTAISTNGTCDGLRNQIAVLSNGTIVPCCLDTDGILALGNIFEHPLESILNNSRTQAILQGFRHAKRIEPLCQRCTFFSIKQKSPI
ncbi:MAG TPA: SPASM domain-containing protein [Salinivirgaceae bacterium]|nr:SPASM domain-containing protein [Salinivirgaceae bacterium]